MVDASTILMPTGGTAWDGLAGGAPARILDVHTGIVHAVDSPFLLRLPETQRWRLRPFQPRTLEET